MAIIDFFRRNKNALKATVQYEEYGDGNELNTPGISIFDTLENTFPLSINESSSKVNYVNKNTKEALTNPTQNTENAPKSEAADSNTWAIDIAQSHHFTVQLRAVGSTKESDKYPIYKVSSSSFGNFLPVKNISLTYSGYETMILPFSSFSDFPLIQRKKIEIVNLTCYDEDTSILEKAVTAWNDECFPGGKYVAYMDNVVKELIYKGYTVDGRESFNLRRYVIPFGPPQVNRDYEENDAKMITFSLACVGDGSTCATGSRTKTREQPVVDNGNSGGATITNSQEVSNFVNDNTISGKNFIGNGTDTPSINTPNSPKSISSKGSTVSTAALMSSPYALPVSTALNGYKVVKGIVGKVKEAVIGSYPHFDDNGNKIK